MTTRLCIEWVNSITGDRRSGITPTGLVIGRDPASDVLLPEPMVSWRHASVCTANGACWVTDLGSTNGTFVNGARLEPSQPYPLRVGDTLYVGGVELRCAETDHDVGPGLPIRIGDRPVGSRALVGRSNSADISLPYPDVSWQHAALTRRPTGWYIEDLGSTNGTFVNGRRVQANSLEPGDRIRIGQT